MFTMSTGVTYLLLNVYYFNFLLFLEFFIFCWNAVKSLENRKGIWSVKSKCWYVDGGDSTGALHVLKLQLSSRIRMPPLSLTVAKSGMVFEFQCLLTPANLQTGH